MKRSHQKRAISLIEAVAAIAVLSIAAPPGLLALDRTAGERADTINAIRAGSLATAVCESVIADVASADNDLGPAALDDLPQYLDTPSTGLRARLLDTTDPYTSVGFSYDVAVSDLSSFSGADQAALGGAGVASAMRMVTVTIDYPSSRGGTLSMPVSFLVEGTP